MSTFLTPPEWYDQNGKLNNMLNCPSGENSVSIMAGGDNRGDNSVVIGWNSGCNDGNNVVIGSGTYIEGGYNNVAIGSGNVAGSGNVFVGADSGGGTTEHFIHNSVAIGSGATVDGDLQIQIGNNSSDYDVRFGKTKPMLVEYLGTETKSFTTSNSRIGFSGNPSADFAAFDIIISDYHRYVIFSYKSNETTTPTWLAGSNKIRMIKISRNSITGIYSGTSFSNSFTIDSGGISLAGWLEEATTATVIAHYYKGVE